MKVIIEDTTNFQNLLPMILLALVDPSYKTVNGQWSVSIVSGCAVLTMILIYVRLYMLSNIYVYPRIYLLTFDIISADQIP